MRKTINFTLLLVLLFVTSTQLEVGAFGLEGPGDDLGEACENITIVEGVNYSCSFTSSVSNDKDLMSFTTENAGSIELDITSTNSSNFYYFRILLNGTQVYINFTPGSYTINLQPDTLYQIEFSGKSSSYSFELNKIRLDLGGTFNIPEVVELNYYGAAVFEGSIENYGDIDYYRFSYDYDTCMVVETVYMNDNLDTIGYWLGHDRSTTDEYDDNSGEGNNFSLRRVYIEADQDAYVKVKAKSYYQTGDYEIRFYRVPCNRIEVYAWKDWGGLFTTHVEIGYFENKADLITYLEDMRDNEESRSFIQSFEESGLMMGFVEAQIFDGNYAEALTPSSITSMILGNIAVNAQNNAEKVSAMNYNINYVQNLNYDRYFVYLQVIKDNAFGGVTYSLAFEEWDGSIQSVRNNEMYYDDKFDNNYDGWADDKLGVLIIKD